MTKNQHIQSIQNLMASTPKLNKKFQEEMELLLNEYKSTKASNKDEIAQVIIKDDIEYAWCNKHECYEISSNFNAGKAPRAYRVCCKAAEAEISSITRLINTQNKIMLDDEATQESAFAALKEKKSLDIIRKGTYKYDARIAEVKGYDYDALPISIENS